MPRDVFTFGPDGKLLMQAWVTFLGRDESTLTREELDIHLTEEPTTQGLAFPQSSHRARACW